MSVVSSGVTLTSDFYLSGFYKDNRSVRKSSGRSSLSSTELSYEDSRALQRAVKKLSSFNFSDDDNLTNLKNTVSAFADTYNNALASSKKDGSSEISRYAKQLKKLATKYSSELEDVGITVSTDGTLEVDTGLLSASSVDKLKSVFSKQNTDLLQSTRQIAKNLQNHSYDALYTQMTGNGGQLNITL
jgi:hypothetical protein